MNSTDESVPWYRLPIMWFIVMVPLSAVIYGTFMITMAIITDDGMVVDDYYKHGKEINLVKDRDHAARRLQLAGTLAISADAGQVRLELGHVPDYQAPEEIRLQMLFSTQAGFDVTTVLLRQADGSYLGNMTTLRQGHWYTLLEADDWRLLGSLVYPQQHSVNLHSQAGDS
jgi:hypothetical protein